MRSNELYERITRHIISSIEAGAADFIMPWHKWGEGTGAPINAITGRSYRGLNTLLLWAAAELGGYSSGRWATYRQWSAAGAQVRKNEKASTILFWKSASGNRDDHDDDDDQRTSRSALVSRVFHVFNSSQVDGALEPTAASGLSAEERVASAEAFFGACGADIAYGGDRAFYMPSADKISVPHFEQFRDAGGFYSVLGHEHIHWTGAERRLNRDLTGRFGSDSYAVEELVAELGAAFICAKLGLSVEPRPDHARYISSWLGVLRNDARAILTVASKAQAAADYLCAIAGGASTTQTQQPVDDLAA
ncbi:zincin-like metallopeptidase domain-containing protein [Sphingomonas swuensis]|uniref:Zincin-like metallopeptidase domain-containing protein n=1 Tax=Sphingomonas swuensis TaxID=977800 RepID=A0ABP7TEY8_9SPHN